MTATLPAAAARLPQADFDVISHGCTSGATLIGRPAKWRRSTVAFIGEDDRPYFGVGRGLPGARSQTFRVRHPLCGRGVGRGAWFFARCGFRDQRLRPIRTGRRPGGRAYRAGLGSRPPWTCWRPLQLKWFLRFLHQFALRWDSRGDARRRSALREPYRCWVRSAKGARSTVKQRS